MSSTKKPHGHTGLWNYLFIIPGNARSHFHCIGFSAWHSWSDATLARQPWSQACLWETHFSLDCASPNHRQVFKRPLKRLWSWRRIQRDRSENKGPSKPGSTEDGGVPESWGSAHAGDDVKLPLTCLSCHMRNKTMKEMKMKYGILCILEFYMSKELIIERLNGLAQGVFLEFLLNRIKYAKIQLGICFTSSALIMEDLPFCTKSHNFLCTFSIYVIFS